MSGFKLLSLFCLLCIVFLTTDCDIDADIPTYKAIDAYELPGITISYNGNDPEDVDLVVVLEADLSCKSNSRLATEFANLDKLDIYIQNEGQFMKMAWISKKEKDSFLSYVYPDTVPLQMLTEIDMLRGLFGMSNRVHSLSNQLKSIAERNPNHRMLSELEQISDFYNKAVNLYSKNNHAIVKFLRKFPDVATMLLAMSKKMEGFYSKYTEQNKNLAKSFSQLCDQIETLKHATNANQHEAQNVVDQLVANHKTMSEWISCFRDVFQEIEKYIFRLECFLGSYDNLDEDTAARLSAFYKGDEEARKLFSSLQAVAQFSPSCSKEQMARLLTPPHSQHDVPSGQNRMSEEKKKSSVDYSDILALLSKDREQLALLIPGEDHPYKTRLLSIHKAIIQPVKAFSNKTLKQILRQFEDVAFSIGDSERLQMLQMLDNTIALAIHYLIVVFDLLIRDMVNVLTTGKYDFVIKFFTDLNTAAASWTSARKKASTTRNE